MCVFTLQPPPARYGGRHTVTLIPGDGIGPELAHHVRELFRLEFRPPLYTHIVWWSVIYSLRRIIRSPSVIIIRFCCVPVDFEVVNVDSSMASEDDINDAIISIRRNGVALKGRCYVLYVCVQHIHTSACQICRCTWTSRKWMCCMCNYKCVLFCQTLVYNFFMKESADLPPDGRLLN